MAWETGSYTNDEWGDRVYDTGMITDPNGRGGYFPKPNEGPSDFYRRSSSSSSSGGGMNFGGGGGGGGYGGGGGLPALGSLEGLMGGDMFRTQVFGGAGAGQGRDWAMANAQLAENTQNRALSAQLLPAQLQAAAAQQQHQMDLEKLRMQLSYQARQSAYESERAREAERARIASQEAMQQRGFAQEDYMGAANLYRGYGIRMGDKY